MSGTQTVDPLIPPVGPFSYGSGLIIKYDFTQTLASGESVSPTVTLPDSIPAGFTRTVLSVSSPYVYVYEVAPTTAGTYILPVPISVVGGAVSPRPYTRSSKASVFQR